MLLIFHPRVSWLLRNGSSLVPSLSRKGCGRFWVYLLIFKALSPYPAYVFLFSFCWVKVIIDRVRKADIIAISMTSRRFPGVFSANRSAFWTGMVHRELTCLGVQWILYAGIFFHFIDRGFCVGAGGGIAGFIHYPWPTKPFSTKALSIWVRDNSKGRG